MTTTPPPHRPFLEDGGELGAMMRAHDWSGSPLGAPEQWPTELLTVVGVMLQSRFPMFVAWGDELGFLYNDAYAEILGAKHPRALGRPFHDIWAEIWPDISPLIDAAMAGRSIYREDLPLLMNRKGFDEQTWFTFSYSPVRVESGEVCGMFCAVAETTGRVLVERQLRDLNDTLERRVTEAIAERQILVDIVEGTEAFVQVVAPDYRWIAINKAAANEFERIFGVRPKVGESMLDLLAGQPEHRAAVQAVWSRALAGDEFVEIAEFGDPARQRRFYEMHYSALRARDGGRIGAYQFAYDVTERIRDQERLREAQEALRQSQKLESLGQLTGGVAHDFNNLLAVFANGLEVLDRKPSEAQRERIHASMRRAIERGSALTRQLLSFSRRRPANPECVDLGAALLGMRDLLARAQPGNIELRMDVPAGLWPVLLDTGEFELAMLNLCVNARDAMNASGRIDIRATNTLLADASGAAVDAVEVIVSDSGSGIDAAILPRVLEPFFTTKDPGKGSGLGLAQVYGFVQQTGGRLSIDSQVGVGTSVVLRLPRSTDAPGAVPEPRGPARAPAPATTEAHVLLVEDDADVAGPTSEMLRGLGCKVTHVESAAAALAALDQGVAADVVLTDVMMPGGMSGLELARKIRARDPKMPVILTSGYPEAAAGMQDGEFVLLAKPYGLDMLCEALQHAGQRR